MDENYPWTVEAGEKVYDDNGVPVPITEDTQAALIACCGSWWCFETIDGRTFWKNVGTEP